MAGKRPDFNLVVTRKGKDGNKHYTTIGSAWLVDKGGISIQFDAIPVSDAQGRTTAVLFPREKED